MKIKQPNSNKLNIQGWNWKNKHLIKKKLCLSKQKYHKVSISCLYLSNWFNLIKKKIIWEIINLTKNDK